MFACAPGLVDKGIDVSLPNEFEANRVCSTSILATNTSGWLSLPFQGFICTDGFVGDDGDCTSPPFFVGFVGLNNGDGTGSMDSWWQESDTEVWQPEPMPIETTVEP